MVSARWAVGDMPLMVSTTLSTPMSWGDYVGAGLEDVLALSRIRYNSFNGEIIDADILFNGALITAPANDQSLIPYDAFDFWTVAVHEFGHAGGGLGDIYNRNDQPYNLLMGSNPVKWLSGGLEVETPPPGMPTHRDVTMYGIIAPTDRFPGTISNDDKAGLAYTFGTICHPMSTWCSSLMHRSRLPIRWRLVPSIIQSTPQSSLSTRCVSGTVSVWSRWLARRPRSTGLQAFWTMVMTGASVKDAIRGITPEADDTRAIGAALGNGR